MHIEQVAYLRDFFHHVRNYRTKIFSQNNFLSSLYQKERSKMPSHIKQQPEPLNVETNGCIFFPNLSPTVRVFILTRSP